MGSSFLLPNLASMASCWPRDWEHFIHSGHFSPPFHPWHCMALSFTKFCHTRISTLFRWILLPQHHHLRSSRFMIYKAGQTGTFKQWGSFPRKWNLNTCWTAHFIWNGWCRISRNSIMMTRHYPDLVSNASSVWNSGVRFADVIWRRETSAVFSGYIIWYRRLTISFWIVNIQALRKPRRDFRRQTSDFRILISD